MAIPSIVACAAALDRGDAENALQLAIERLRRNKDDVEALTICYRAYTQKNDSANAIKALEIIVQKEPQAYWARAALGRLLLAAGMLARAEEELRRAVETNPGDGPVHAALGVLFSELNKLEAGEWHLRRALQIAGPDCETLTQLALNLAQQGKAEQADALYGQALEIDPRSVRTLGYRAKLKEVQGDLADARALLARADKVQAGGVSLLEAQLLLREGQAREALAILDGASRLNGDALLERARIKDRLGDFDGAWADASEAKRRLAIEAGGLVYNADGVDAFFDELKTVFDAQFFDELPKADGRSDVQQPIFVLGSPRSGTTLLERILGSHSRIRAAGELPYVGEFRELSERLLGRGKFPQNFLAVRAADRRQIAAQLRDAYLAQRAGRLAGGEETLFITDKMPFNEMYLPLIRMAFPDCPIIHLSRNRLDTAVSILFNKLNHGFHCGYRIEDVIHHLDAVRGLLDHYRSQVDPQLLEVRYESLVTDTESEVRRMLQHIGLEFEAACLGFYERPAYVATPSYSDVNRQIGTRSVDRHTHYLAHLREFADRDGLQPNQ